MSEKLVSTLTVEFDEDAESSKNSCGLILERHIGYTGLSAGIPFRQYPQIKTKLVCTNGTISETPELRVSKEKETIVFSGNKTAKLKKPVATNVKCEVIGGTAFNDTGGVAYPKIEYDSVKDEIKSNIPFYGAVAVSYESGYYLHYYSFKTDVDPITGGVTIYTHDIVHAFYGKCHAQLEMDISFKMKEQWMPLYKVVSKIALDELGVWEYPPNWESTDSANRGKTQDDPKRDKKGDGEFPGYTDHKIDEDMHFVDTRVHQIGEYDFLGRVKTSIPNDLIGVQEPYVGKLTLPSGFDSLARMGLLTFHLEKAPKPTWKKSMSYSEKTWVDAYLSVDMDEIKKDLKSDYFGIKDENGKVIE